jgi:TolA-binding protein
MRLILVFLVAMAIAFPATSVAQDAIASKLIEKLEKESASLTDENRQLAAKIDELTSENESLKSKIAELEERLEKPNERKKRDEKQDPLKEGMTLEGSRQELAANEKPRPWKAVVSRRTPNEIVLDIKAVSTDSVFKWKFEVIGNKLVLKTVEPTLGGTTVAVNQSFGTLSKNQMQFSSDVSYFVNGKSVNANAQTVFTFKIP